MGELPYDRTAPRNCAIVVPEDSFGWEEPGLDRPTIERILRWLERKPHESRDVVTALPDGDGRRVRVRAWEKHYVAYIWTAQAGSHTVKDRSSPEARPYQVRVYRAGSYTVEGRFLHLSGFPDPVPISDRTDRSVRAKGVGATSDTVDKFIVARRVHMNERDKKK